jgi:hypothetical protein
MFENLLMSKIINSAYSPEPGAAGQPGFELPAQGSELRLRPGSFGLFEEKISSFATLKFIYEVYCIVLFTAQAIAAYSRSYQCEYGIAHSRGFFV